MQIYLAHSFSLRKKAVEIQARLESIPHKNIKVLNPFFRGKELREDIKEIEEGKSRPYCIFSKEDAAKIVIPDLEEIRKSDVLLVLIDDKGTLGTSCEVMYAWMLHIPIFIVCFDKEMLGHPWAVYLTGQNVFDETRIDEVIEKLSTLALLFCFRVE